MLLGTRQSRLALWQTNFIADQLRQQWPHLTCELHPFTTKGDETQKAGIPLPEIGGKGLFTFELEEALRTGQIDIAVHSLKDLPVENAPDLTIGAIPLRAPVHDVLITQNGGRLADLPHGATVGTSSKRRGAQLLAHRPDLNLQPIRGNVETRIRKVQEEKQYDATLLAAAGLDRLSLHEAISEWLPLTIMLPAPGQGALAVQCRADDAETLRLLAPLDHLPTRQAVTAERQFLHALGGGCSAPVAAYAQWEGEELHLQTWVLWGTPEKIYQLNGRGTDPTALGQSLAQQILAQAQPPQVE